jgi:hypothetical protein
LCQRIASAHSDRTSMRRIDNYDRSAVNISSFANGAFGHRRQDRDGIRLEIAAARWRSSVRRSTAPTTVAD